MQKRECSLKKTLINEGIKSLTINGNVGLSLRGLSRECGVSCAALFKHFKDKQDFFREIGSCLDRLLFGSLQLIAKEYQGDVWRTYVEVSVSYIEYLVAHPFLMDISFWQQIDPAGGNGLRQWDSFRLVIDSFREYSRHLDLSEAEYQRVYFSMQTLTYGLPYMAIASLLNMEADYKQLMRSQMEAIFAGYPRM